MNTETLEPPKAKLVEPQTQIISLGRKEKMVVIDSLTYESRRFKTKYSWNKAVKYCSDMEFGGYINWRLPEKNELNRLKTKKKHKGNNGEYFIRQEFTDDLDGGSFIEFWTNTEYNNDSAWVVRFDYKADNVKYNKTSMNYVLCVSGE